MNLFRYALIVVTVLLSAASSANWTALALGASGSRSITTFNGAIYVATFNTGIRKSINDGASWSLANTGLPVTNGFVNAQSVGHSATALFCGTESGIYRSTDNGASWVLANGPLPANNLIYANKFYTFSGVTFAVFTGTVSQNAGGVFRTTDNGNSWLQGFSGLSGNMTVYNIDEVGGVLYAATSTALMKSNDLGQSWVQVGATNYAVYSVQGVGNRIVAITAFGARWSINGGNTWTNSTNYPVAAPAAGSELIAYDNKYFAITKSASLGCYRSLDGGVSWQAFNTGLSAQNTFSGAQEEFHASGNHLYIACLFDSYSTPGTTSGITDAAIELLPMAYPTVFSDFFTVDLSALEGIHTVLLVDASGREVLRRVNLPAALQRIDRGDLVAGRYHCMLLDPASGSMRSFGSVIAQ